MIAGRRTVRVASSGAPRPRRAPGRRGDAFAPGRHRRVTTATLAAATLALVAIAGLPAPRESPVAASPMAAGAAVGAQPPPADSTPGRGLDLGSRPPRTVALPDPTWTPSEVRDAADEVLDGAEFQRSEPNVFEKARAWVEERIGRVLQGLVTGDGASVLGWIVLLASVVAIGLLLARFGRSVQRDPTTATAVSVERARTAAQWVEEAERLEAGREWKPALRCRFRALVASLVEQGRVDDVPGRTAGEYRAEVDAGLAEATADFAEATYLFEDAWYGDEPTGPTENERFRSLAAAVLAASAERRAEGAAGPVVTEAEAVSP